MLFAPAGDADSDRRAAACRDEEDHGGSGNEQARRAKIGLIPVNTPDVDGIEKYLASERDKWGIAGAQARAGRDRCKLARHPDRPRKRGSIQTDPPRGNPGFQTAASAARRPGLVVAGRLRAAALRPASSRTADRRRACRSGSPCAASATRAACTSLRSAACRRCDASSHARTAGWSRPRHSRYRSPSAARSPSAGSILPPLVR